MPTEHFARRAIKALERRQTKNLWPNVAATLRYTGGYQRRWKSRQKARNTGARVSVALPNDRRTRKWARLDGKSLSPSGKDENETQFLCTATIDFLGEDLVAGQTVASIRYGTLYTLSQKTRHQTLGQNFTNYYPIFKFYFTSGLGSKFATNSYLNIPPRFKHVATLFCEIWMSENGIILKYVLHLMNNHKVL